MLVHRVSLEAVRHVRHGGYVGGVADRTGRSRTSAAASSLTQPRPVGVVLADPAAVVAAGARCITGPPADRPVAFAGLRIQDK
jgi:hypothetical protein